MLNINLKGRATKLSKTLLTAGLLGAAALTTLGAGSAQAAVLGQKDCSFGTSAAHPSCSGINWTTGWTLGDKTLKNFGFAPGTPAGGPPSGVFSFIQNFDLMYSTLVIFDPFLPPPNSGSYAYDLVINPGNGYSFNSVELDVDHFGSGQQVTKTIVGGGSPVLVSMNGAAVGPVPLSGTSITVTDSWELDPSTGQISVISNTFTQVPAPLPLLGVGAVLGSIRKLRKFSSQLKTFSLG